MIIPIMPTVNNWLTVLTLNPENVINAHPPYHAGVIERPHSRHGTCPPGATANARIDHCLSGFITVTFQLASILSTMNCSARSVGRRPGSTWPTNESVT
jgi:hypothetical protein